MRAVVFPGQGSQCGGMGAALAATWPAAREVFEQADQVLGFSLSELCFTGSDDDLKPTEIAQPALLATGLAAWRVVAADLGEVACLAGHSLGEYTALVAAGALSLESGLRLVRRRGELMRDAAVARPGVMAAVLKLTDEQVAEFCAATPGVVTSANYNSPGQVVISGEEVAVEAVLSLVKEAGGRGVKLPVSGAFHSPLMAPAAEAMAAELAAVEFAAPRTPVIQNVTAAPTRDPEVLRANLVAQITGSVRWTESVRRMVAEGVRQVIELGPQNVLCGLVRRIDKSVACHNIADPVGVEGLAAFLGSEVSE